MDGTPLCTSGSLPGSVHDLRVARIWDIIRRVQAGELITLVDMAYVGAGEGVLVPHKKRRNKRQSRAMLQGLGERANAVLKAWRVLRKLRCCLLHAGQLVKAILVPQLHEAR
ncbi:transposase family protein [Spongiactinospora sp. 9N601]|uniref:transposase family protein n=1 Tax=Spongiactinospora sp. 9N601 TaxID=3375149 RepID=UPI00378C9623